MIELIGFLASIGAVSMWLPQALRAYRHRHDAATLAGLSIVAFSTAVVFNGLLLVYGIGTDSAPIALSGGANFVMSALIVGIVARGRLT